MTVRELIEKLQAFDTDLHVVVTDPEFMAVEDLLALRIDDLTSNGPAYPGGERVALEGESVTRRALVLMTWWDKEVPGGPVRAT